MPCRIVEKMDKLALRAATVEFTPKDVPGQGGTVADFFVATNSNSPIILATGGAGSVAWRDTRHVTVILCKPHTQGGKRGIRVRVNFVGDKPPPNESFQITLAQVGAEDFAAPETTTPAQ